MEKYVHLKDLDKVFDSFSSGIFIIDELGFFVVGNYYACKTVNINKTSIQGKNLHDVDLFSKTAIKEILKSGKKSISQQVKFENKDFIFNIRPFYNENIVFFTLVVFQNYSNRERSLKEYLAIEKIIEIVEYGRNDAADGYWVNDRNGKVVAINSVSAQRSNIDQEAAIGVNVDIFLDSGEVDTLVTREVIATKRNVTCIQKLKNGKQILATGTPLFDSKGDLDLIVISEKEITETQLFPDNFPERKVLLHHPSAHHKDVLDTSAGSSDYIFESEVIKNIFETAMQIAAVDSNVFIQGESGVGKSFFAKIIHQHSHRSTEPFNRVDCAAIPETLIESELFGYEKGAFTGAKAEGKPGQFELTNGGTLFLDEISELPVNIQAKLLRFFDDKVVFPVGGIKSKILDVRVIAASNKDLVRMVEKGTFREDLFYRINVVPIKVPPLRARIEDITPLIHFHLNKLNKKYSTSISISEDAMNILNKYPFPGNVRELSNLVERLVVLCKKQQIDVAQLPDEVMRGDLQIKTVYQDDEWNLQRRVEEMEREFIIKAMRVFKTQKFAAEKMGIKQSTLSRKIKRFRITSNELSP